MMSTVDLDAGFVRFFCWKCGKSLKVRFENAANRSRCPKCGAETDSTPYRDLADQLAEKRSGPSESHGSHDFPEFPDSDDSAGPGEASRFPFPYERDVSESARTMTMNDQLQVMDVVAARNKNFTGHAMLASFLTCFFVVPGLLTSIGFYAEAKRTEKVAGRKLTGTDFLGSLIVFQVAAIALVVIIFITPT